jgi:hypothetical protein
MDNASPHNSGRTQRYIETSRAERLPHPANSPTLAPSDFFLFGYIQCQDGFELSTYNRRRRGTTEFCNYWEDRFRPASLPVSSVNSPMFHSVRHQFRAGRRSPTGASESSAINVNVAPASLHVFIGEFPGHEPANIPIEMSQAFPSPLNVLHTF